MISRFAFLRYAKDSFFQAVYALRDNSLRTILSVLGIAFGVGAVMTVSTVSESGRHYVFSELQTYGLETIWVYRKWEDEHPYAAIRQGSGITNQDINIILNSGCCPAVRQLSPIVYHRDWRVLVRVGNNFSKISVEGVGTTYLSISNDVIAVGRGLREEDIKDRQPVALITPRVHENMFGLHTNPIGKSIRLGNVKLTVIGIIKEKSRKFLMSIGAETYDTNNRIIIPYTLYQQILGTEEIHSIQAEAIDVESTHIAAQQIVNALRRSHHNKYQYIQETMRGWIDTANRILSGISLIGIVGASVSLLVGGLGIMNIMSTSVIERTREIGIRKAIGARRRDILTQFLMEALFISVLGGLVGLLLGALVNYALAIWTMFPISLSAISIALALIVSILVGVMSGYYPAYRASLMRPVEALRYD